MYPVKTRAESEQGPGPASVTRFLPGALPGGFAPGAVPGVGVFIRSPTSFPGLGSPSQ